MGRTDKYRAIRVYDYMGIGDQTDVLCMLSDHRIVVVTIDLIDGVRREPGYILEKVNEYFSEGIDEVSVNFEDENLVKWYTYHQVIIDHMNLPHHLIGGVVAIVGAKLTGISDSIKAELKEVEQCKKDKNRKKRERKSRVIL